MKLKSLRRKRIVQRHLEFQKFVDAGGLAELRKIKFQLAKAIVNKIYYPLNPLESLKIYLIQNDFKGVFGSKFAFEFMRVKKKERTKVKIPESLSRLINQCEKLPVDGNCLLKEANKVIREITRSFYFAIEFLSSFGRFSLDRLPTTGTEKVVFVVGHQAKECRYSSSDDFSFAKWLAEGKDRVTVFFLSERSTLKAITSEYLDVTKPNLVLAILYNLRNLRRSLVMNYVDILRSLHQIVFLTAIQSSKIDANKFSFFFTESTFPTQPPWARHLEDIGIETQFIHFSNSSHLSIDSESFALYPDHLFSSWKKLLVNSQLQEHNFLRASLNPYPEVSVVGTPWKSDAHDEQLVSECELFKSVGIATFDYGGVFGHFGQSTIMDLGFGNLNSQLHFLDEMVEICEKLDLVVVHKPKRATSRTSFIQNEFLVDRYKSTPAYRQINPEVAPQRLILACHASVSMPPTSTGLIGASLGKPTVFYDHIGKILEHDPALAGIPIIKGKEQMENWLVATVQI